MQKIILVIAATSVLPLAACGQQDTLTEALALYRQNKLVEALPLFEAAAESLHTAEAYAWFAETARRQKQFDRARSAARQALSLESCHSFAHTVLGNTFKPVYGSEGVNRDSAWVHLSTAVECDPSDGNAWIAIWTEAIDRGDREVEERALRRLIEAGFLTPSVLAFNRWVLESLPDSALLITNGDRDTFPALALQLVEGLRPDVGIVNRPMLNVRSYANLVSTRFGVSLPMLDDERSLPEQVIGHWRMQHVDGALGRELVLAPSTNRDVFPEGAGTLQFAGVFWRIVRPGEPDIDSRSMVFSLDAVRGSDFVTPEVSPGDRSAVRMMAAQGRWLTKTVLYASLRYARALSDDGRQQEADEVFKWAERYVSEARLGAEEREWIEQAKERR